MLRQLRHDVWATERLLAHVRRLAPDQLELSVPGTYGSVRKTLGHIVGADENYLVRLTGARLHDQPYPGPDIGLDEISAHLAHVKDGVERLFAADVDGERLIADTPLRRPEQARIEMNAWVPLT